MIDQWEGLQYRLYCLGDDGKPHGIAEAPDAASIGLALITIAEENRLAGLPAETVGVLDWWGHRWLTSPGWVPKKVMPFQ